MCPVHQRALTPRCFRPVNSASWCFSFCFFVCSCAKWSCSRCSNTRPSLNVEVCPPYLQKLTRKRVPSITRSPAVRPSYLNLRSGHGPALPRTPRSRSPHTPSGPESTDHRPRCWRSRSPGSSLPLRTFSGDLPESTRSIKYTVTLIWTASTHQGRQQPRCKCKHLFERPMSVAVAGVMGAAEICPGRYNVWVSMVPTVPHSGWHMGIWLLMKTKQVS